MTFRTTIQLILVDCILLQQQQMQEQQRSPVVDRRQIIDDAVIYGDASSWISDYSDDSSLFEDDVSHCDDLDDDDCRTSSSTNHEKNVVNLLSEFDDLHDDSLHRQTPSIEAFLANLEKHMASIATSPRRHNWQDNDDDSLVLTRNRGIPSMKFATEEEDDENVDSSLSDDWETHIISLKDTESEQNGEDDSALVTPRRRTIKRRTIPGLRRRRNLDAPRPL